jgi:hypothetical protein
MMAPGTAGAYDTTGMAGGEDHFDRLRRLLDLEARAQAEQAAERAARSRAPGSRATGERIDGLVIADEEAGVGGRSVLTLARAGRRAPLPWSTLGPGCPVAVSAGGGTPGGIRLRGVVCERTETHLRVAVDAPPPDERSWTVERVHDEVALRRMREAVERARAAGRGRLAELRAVLLGESAARFDPVGSLAPLDPSLDRSQREAVELALAAQDVAIVHGPPGTGKTTALVELIRQAVRRGERVLACAPSNLAVDNMLERLIAAGERTVRLGHPERVLPQLRERTLDAQVERHPDVRLARQLARRSREAFRRASRFTRAAPLPGQRRGMRQEARDLRADARRLEEQAIESVLDSATVLCATTTGLDPDLLRGRRFDLAVIDEACQSTEPGCWIPLAMAGRLVVAGDHFQLPPTVVSPEASAGGLGVSLMERLVAIHGEAITRRLKLQYRMHRSIMEFPGREFYGGELEAHPSVAAHRLCDLPGVATARITEHPLELVDTAGSDAGEQLEPGGDSRFNAGEAALVARRVQALIGAGVRPEDIAVITPYSAQVRLLGELLAVPGLEIDSVDGFQGREKEAVVVSLVRSNREGELGFLRDVRRMNVALTRARRRLVVVGDGATLAVDPFYQRLVDHFGAAGAHRSVWEEDDEHGAECCGAPGHSSTGS